MGWHTLLDAFRRVEAVSPVVKAAIAEAELTIRAQGTCPACGVYNQPDSDAQVGQDIRTVYCVACGETWTIQEGEA